VRVPCASPGREGVPARPPLDHAPCRVLTLAERTPCPIAPVAEPLLLLRVRGRGPARSRPAVEFVLGRRVRGLKMIVPDRARGEFVLWRRVRDRLVDRAGRDHARSRQLRALAPAARAGSLYQQRRGGLCLSAPGAESLLLRRVRGPNSVMVELIANQCGVQKVLRLCAGRSVGVSES